MQHLMTKTLTASVLAVTLTLAGCGGGAPMNNATTGAIAGSVLGGVVGHQFGEGDGKDLATIAGAVLGGYIGSQMGSQYDRQYLGQAVATGSPVSWQNPQTGYRYTATPGQTYRTSTAQVCRPVNVTGYIDGRAENIQMRACRQPNGQWTTTN